MEPTAKTIQAMNSIEGKNFLWDIKGFIDTSTMSRILWIAYDEGIQKWFTHIKANSDLVHNPVLNTHNQKNKTEDKKKKNDDRDKQMVVNWNTRLYTNDDFLTIFDSCQPILSNFDIKDMKSSLNKSKVHIPQDLLSIWEPREMHHTKLLLDGIIKLRCLFQDHDSTFTAKPVDYEVLERLLTRIFKGWNTNLREPLSWKPEELDIWYQSKYGKEQSRL
jgi:hypothetical protein